MSSTSKAAIANTLSFMRANYCNLSARALFLWDFCATFDDEVRYVWSQKMNPATMLFMVNRYVNLLITILELLEQAPFQTVQAVPLKGTCSCGPLVRVLQFLLVLDLFIVSTFATLRIYAIWGCDWRPALPVLLLSLVSPVLNIVMDVKQGTVTAPSPSHGCAVINKISAMEYSRFSIVNRATTTAYDGIALLLTLVKTIRFKGCILELKAKSDIIRLLLRDGALHFLVLFIINLAQIIVTSHVSGNNYLSYYVSPLTSMLLSRFLLNLRQAASLGTLFDSNALTNFVGPYKDDCLFELGSDGAEEGIGLPELSLEGTHINVGEGSGTVIGLV